MSEKLLLNINVGVLGHVDCGKTTLAKSMSKIGSTAAFDANPQSQERGITIDLGFSSFTLDGRFNVTLVDCPGHASLIKTVIGGAQIMDIMILCIDIAKGVQVQTKECLDIAQRTCDKLIVTFTKLDLIEPSQREKKIASLQALVKRVMQSKRFADCPVAFVSATDESIGTHELETALLRVLENLKLNRNVDAPLVMAIDHCFQIKGQGTICTGTILQGKLKINDTVEIPSLKIEKKVKSIQSFRIPMKVAEAGDRVGVCLAGTDSSKLERGLLSLPGYVHGGVTAGVICFDDLPSVKNDIVGDKMYDIFIGYENVEAKVYLIRTPRFRQGELNFDKSEEYEYVTSLKDKPPENKEEICPSIYSQSTNSYEYFALTLFKFPTMIIPKPLVIGAHLSLDGGESSRILFSGHLVDFSQDKEPKLTYLARMNIFKYKTKKGCVDRFRNQSEVLVLGFCEKESSVQHLLGLKVIIHPKESGTNITTLNGTITSRFGQTRKMVVSLSSPIDDSMWNIIEQTKGSDLGVSLNYKKACFRGPSGSKIYQ